VNTEGIRAITRQTRSIRWSCRYGILTTPKTSPSVDRVARPTETHIVEIKGAFATLKMSSKIMYIGVMLIFQCTRETLGMAQQTGTRLHRLQVHIRYNQGLSNYMEQQKNCYELSHTFFIKLFSLFSFLNYFLFAPCT
jgi:hypothetical protein